MSKFLKIKDIGSVNTAESTYGDSLLCGDKLIIPYFNVHIDLNNHEFLKQDSGKYIKFCYLVFEGVFGVVWDYDLSRSVGSENRECYGGTYFYDNKDYEFWIKYNQGFIYLEKGYQSSSHPWKLSSYQRDFFQSNFIDSEIKG